MTETLGAPGSRRMPWARLPGSVRAAVQQILGANVETADSQPGGFSSGSADRVSTSIGTTAFVKAISTSVNAGAAALHRREARIAAALPSGIPAPRLLGIHDDGDWIALVLEGVDGRNPALPWREDDLTAVLDTLQTVSARLTPNPVPDLPAAADVLAEPLTGWHRIAATPPADLDAWAADHLAQLCALADTALSRLHGRTLVHYDMRADNLLIRPDGTVIVVDWPWACRGPAWLDTLMLLTEVHLYGGHDVDALLGRGVTARADPATLTSFLVAHAGYFLDEARREPPPGMDSLRAFQHVKGSALLAWIRRRLAN